MLSVRIRYLLDADTLRLLLNGNKQVLLRASQVPSDCLWISVVTLQEALSGWISHIQQEQNKSVNKVCAAYDRLAYAIRDLAEFNILHYSPEAHQTFQSFPPPAKLVGANDHRLAASAIANDMIVVTRNTRHFERIGGARHEDWSVDPESS